ncbi:MAG: TonB family protein / TonB-dependent receptor [Myxococcales bacterium]|nr:TonB family protein / TonB-dependent receptor [Myxococcales bacterium]
MARRVLWLCSPMHHLRTTLSALLFASLLTAAPAGAQPVATPPTIATFVPADYPTAARDAGREASVELEVTVGADGRVLDARVLALVGDGFDEAALAAVRQFVFAPAIKDGAPIAARIHYRYAFTLERPAPVVAAPAAVVSGRIEGRILSRADGVALGGVEVVATSAKGGVHRVTTDESGGFAIDELPAGHYHIAISALDHAAFAQDEDVIAGEAAEVTYRLDSTAAREDTGSYGAVATIEAPVREITRRSLEGEELTKLAGTRGDPLRALELLPGVARPASGAGTILVRGSAPGDSQVFFDGAPVSQLYHLGGLTSFVNGSLLKSVELFPGNFSTHYGRKIGGVIEAELRDPLTDRLHAKLDLNMIDASALVEGPINDKTSFAIGGRRSHIDAWIGPLLRATDAPVAATPVYTDWQAITTYKPDSNNRLRLIGYGSTDELQVVLANPSGASTTRDRLGVDGAFHRVRADWKRTWPGLDQEISVTGGKNRFAIEVGGLLGGGIDAYEVFGRADWHATASKYLQFAWGLDVHHTIGDVWYSGPQIPQVEGNPDKTYRGDRLNEVHVDEKGGTWFRPAAYAEATIAPVAPLAITAGVRVDRFADIDQTTVDPRLTARYTLGATTFKGGLGQFSQPPTEDESIPGFGNPGLRAQQAIHYGLGFDHKISSRMSVGVEGYYKSLDHMIVAGPGGMKVNAGSGRIYGAEFAGRWQPGGPVSGLVSYTLSRSERNDAGMWRLFDYDQTHILTVASSVKLGRGWEVGGTFRLVSGNPETPVSGSIFDADIDSYRALYGAINSTRSSTFHRLDVRVEKQFQIAGHPCAGYLDLQNAYNRSNREGTEYSFDYRQQNDIPGLPLIPSLGIKGEL